MLLKVPASTDSEAPPGRCSNRLHVLVLRDEGHPPDARHRGPWSVVRNYPQRVGRNTGSTPDGGFRSTLSICFVSTNSRRTRSRYTIRCAGLSCPRISALTELAEPGGFVPSELQLHQGACDTLLGECKVAHWLICPLRRSHVGAFSAAPWVSDFIGV
ncbi:hypothetical protein BC826DRAFT_986162 [Russula brevipes]|nr:hypothetical protein BC826DRAFT_986162 [Russula brevipes]